MQSAQPHFVIERFATALRIVPAERVARAEELRDFSQRLQGVSEQARKLLVHIAQLAYHGRGQQRKADVAYLPELHESCGLDVDAMYSLLKELRAAKFIEVEDQYPFEDVKILPCGRDGMRSQPLPGFPRIKRSHYATFLSKDISICCNESHFPQRS
jgi:hypothetical protein